MLDTLLLLRSVVRCVLCSEPSGARVLCLVWVCLSAWLPSVPFRPETWDLTTMVQKIQDLERNQEKVGETLAELQAQHQETVGVLSSVAHTLTQM